MYNVTLTLPDGQRVPWRRLPSIPPVNTRLALPGQHWYIVDILLHAGCGEDDVSLDLTLGHRAVPTAVVYTPDAVPRD